MLLELMQHPVRNVDLDGQDLEGLAPVDGKHLVRLDIFTRGAELEIVLKLGRVDLLLVTSLLNFVLVARLVLGSFEKGTRIKQIAT